jgi:hypothetical protein
VGELVAFGCDEFALEGRIIEGLVTVCLNDVVLASASCPDPTHRRTCIDGYVGRVELEALAACTDVDRNLALSRHVGVVTVLSGGRVSAAASSSVSVSAVFTVFTIFAVVAVSTAADASGYACRCRNACDLNESSSVHGLHL